MPFEEPPLSLELFTPDIGCNTAKVYKTFHDYLLRTVNVASFFGWDQMDSRTLLSLIVDPIALNDLYPAALATYPELEKLNTKGWFFSGSGSTFFRIKDDELTSFNIYLTEILFALRDSSFSKEI